MDLNVFSCVFQCTDAEGSAPGTSFHFKDGCCCAHALGKVHGDNVRADVGADHVDAKSNAAGKPLEAHLIADMRSWQQKLSESAANASIAKFGTVGNFRKNINNVSDAAMAENARELDIGLLYSSASAAALAIAAQMEEIDIATSGMFSLHVSERL